MIFRRKPVENQAARARQRQDRRPVQNQTFSYYAARSQSEVTTGREAVQNKPPIRRLPSRLQRLRRHGGWLLVGIVAIGLLAFQLQLSTTPRIVTLSATSEAPFLQDAAVYQKAAHELFNTSAVNRNKLTVDSGSIARKLEALFPELQEVSVSMPVFGDKPVVYIKPAQPALVLAANNGGFIVDENGRALAAVTSDTVGQRLQIPTITDQSALTVTLGDQVLPSTATDFIAMVNQQFKAKGVAIQSMVLPAAAGELDVYIAGQPYFVKFNIQTMGQGDGLRQIGTSLATIKKLQAGGTIPSQYIDVRLEGRAYYL